VTAKWKSILAGEKIGPSFTDLPHGLMQSMIGWGMERINGLMHSILGLINGLMHGILGLINGLMHSILGLIVFLSAVYD